MFASVLRSAHWDLDGEIARTKDVTRRTTLLDRRRLLGDVASQLTRGDAHLPVGLTETAREPITSLSGQTKVAARLGVGWEERLGTRHSHSPRN